MKAKTPIFFVSAALMAMALVAALTASSLALPRLPALPTIPQIPPVNLDPNMLHRHPRPSPSPAPAASPTPGATAAPDASPAASPASGGGASGQAAATSQPTSAPAGEQRTPWFGAKVGDTIVYEFANGTKMVYKVTKVDETNATVQVTSSLINGEQATSYEESCPRRGQWGDKPGVTPNALEVKELPAETVTISGMAIQCKVTECKINAGAMMVTFKTWTSDQVPTQIVRQENNAGGRMTWTQALKEYKHGGAGDQAAATSRPAPNQAPRP